MPRTMRALLKSARDVTILEKTAKGKDFVVLKVKVVTSLIPGKEGALETYMVGLKENNVWRVAAVGAEPKPKILANAEAARAFLTKEVESIKKGAAKRYQALKKIIPAVKEGKYKSREEALDTLYTILFPTNAPKKDSHSDWRNTDHSMARWGMTR